MHIGTTGHGDLAAVLARVVAAGQNVAPNNQPECIGRSVQRFAKSISAAKPVSVPTANFVPSAFQASVLIGP